jgi:hypothetical protein
MEALKENTYKKEDYVEEVHYDFEAEKKKSKKNT